MQYGVNGNGLEHGWMNGLKTASYFAVRYIANIELIKKKTF